MVNLTYLGLLASAVYLQRTQSTVLSGNGPLARGLSLLGVNSAVKVSAASTAIVASVITHKLYSALCTPVTYPGVRFCSILCTHKVKAFLLGNAADDITIGRPQATLRYCDTERAVGTTVGRWVRLSISHPDDVHHILSDAYAYPKQQGYRLSRAILGDGLFSTLDEEAHAVHRRIVAPAFSPKAMQHIAGICIPSHTRRFLHLLQEKCNNGTSTSGVLINMSPLFSELTTDMIAQAAFKLASDKSDVERQKVNTINTAIADSFKELLWLPRIIPIVEKLMFKTNRMCARRKQEITAVAYGVIEDYKAQQTQDEVDQDVQNERASALLDYLLAAEGPATATTAAAVATNKKLSMSQIAEHCTTFMFAGSDTTSQTLNWVFYCISRHPEVQEKVAEELSSAMALGQTCTIDQVKGCRYLRAVIKEAMRLYPIAIVLPRRAAKEDVLPGTKTYVAEGTSVNVGVIGMHRAKNLWGADAEAFSPDRWFNPPPESSLVFKRRHSQAEGGGGTSSSPSSGLELEAYVDGYCFIPFSYGKRNCIGKDLAWAELVVVTASILRSFEFHWPQGQPDVELWMPQLALASRMPYELRVERRGK